MSKPSRYQIARAAVNRLNRGSGTKKVARELAAYLLSEKRTSDLEPLMRDIIKIRAEDGIVEATAVSAQDLTTQLQQALMKLAASDHKAYQSVILNQEHDPTLLGGVRLSSVDRQVDLSIRSRLNSLSKSVKTEGI